MAVASEQRDQRQQDGSEGKGQKCLVHLLSPEDLKARSMKNAKAQLVIDAYP